MMLMLWNWVSQKFELAMLLDEAPYTGYTASTTAHEPWHPESNLTAAARSVDLEGHAWLYVVFLSDKAATWGSKQVKVVAGGSIFCKEMSTSGVWTGQYTQLAYEVVARHIFHNAGGEDSKARYKLIQSAEIQHEEDTQPPQPAEKKEKKDKREKKDKKDKKVKKETAMGTGMDAAWVLDELLGWPVREVEKKTPHKMVPFVPQAELGCTLTWEDDSQYTEKWFVQDLEGFLDFRFYLTEYDRRPYVQLILGRLGFVRPSGEKGEKEGEERVVALAEACSGHLQNVAESLKSLVGLAKCEGLGKMER